MRTLRTLLLVVALSACGQTARPDGDLAAAIAGSKPDTLAGVSDQAPLSEALKQATGLEALVHAGHAEPVSTFQSARGEINNLVWDLSVDSVLFSAAFERHNPAAAVPRIAEGTKLRVFESLGFDGAPSALKNFDRSSPRSMYLVLNWQPDATGQTTSAGTPWSIETVFTSNGRKIEFQGPYAGAEAVVEEHCNRDEENGRLGLVDGEDCSSRVVCRWDASPSVGG